MNLGPTLRFAALMSLATAALGCGDEDRNSSSGGDGGSGGSVSASGGAGVGGGGAVGGGGPPECEAGEVPCSDEVILGMDLQPDPAPGLITSAAEGAGWLTKVDATAGGAFATDPHAYVYGKFTDAGLTKVDISDEASLESSDWDIAFRRYIVRINSGYSGPSCVTAARVPGMAVDYDGLAAVPGGLTYREDEYFTESCELIPDGSGLPNSPATALSSYWTYPECVAMTGNVFVMALADGRQLKLKFTHYYNEAAQVECDTNGGMPAMGNDAANFQIRWAFLP